MTLRILERGTQETSRAIRTHRLKAELAVLEQIPATLLRLESSDNTAFEAKLLETFVPEARYQQITMMDHWRVGYSDFTYRVPLWRRIFTREGSRLFYSVWLREDGAIVKNVRFITGRITITTPYDMSDLPVGEFTELLRELKKIHDVIAQPHY